MHFSFTSVHAPFTQNTASMAPAPDTSAQSSEKDMAKKGDLPDQKQLLEAAASAQKAIEAHGYAQKLIETAKTLKDPQKREKMLRDAYEKEMEAHGNSKKARMLQSGAFQGAAGGAGIGGAVGAGVGTLVGTLVGGLTAIPTTALGGLVGAGVGAGHGPWIKLPPLLGKKSDKNGKDSEGKDIKLEDKEGQEDVGKGNGKDDGDEDGLVPDPEVLRKAADAVAAERAKQEKERGTQEEESPSGADGKPKKKPKKLEIRSKPQQQTQGA